MSKPLPRKFSEGHPVQKILIGVTGGSAAGKTTLCNNIYKQMIFDGSFKVHIICLDSFYKGIDKTKVNIADYNFDHPDALDFDQAYRVLQTLLNGQTAKVPKYCFVTHNRLEQVQVVQPTQVIIFEGILAFYDERIRELMKYKIFMHCDDDIRLCRRIKRDVEQRGRTIENVLYQYNRFVKSAYANYIYPTIKYADLIVPGSRSNKVSLDFIIKNMKAITKQIEFYNRAIQNLIYFYGDLIQSLEKTKTSQEQYLLKEQTSYTEFFFPSTDRQKKQLDLFMSQLTNQSFTREVYLEILDHQFLRILYGFINKIISLKNYKEEAIQVIHYTNLQELAKVKLDDKKRVKVLYVPYISSQSAYVQNFRKNLQKSEVLIVLNIFCDNSKIRHFSEFEKTYFVNLFCIADHKRFITAMQKNLREESSFDLFEHPSFLSQHIQQIEHSILLNLKK